MRASAMRRAVERIRADEGLIKVQSERQGGNRDSSMDKYMGKSALYFKEVLGIESLWSKIAEVLESVHQPPYRTLVKSGHKIGKSFS